MLWHRVDINFVSYAIKCRTGSLRAARDVVCLSGAHVCSFLSHKWRWGGCECDISIDGVEGSVGARVG